MEQDILLSKQEVVRLLKISESTLERITLRGELTAIRIGRRARFNAKEVAAYINEQTRKAKTAAHDSGNQK